MCRMEQRVVDTVASGGTPREDDNAAAFRKRLDTYRIQTAPVSNYYRGIGDLHVVDGMAAIEQVTASIGDFLQDKQAGRA